MNTDRNWMNHSGMSDRRKMEYIESVDEFLNFAFSGKENGTELRCPCLRCNYQNFHVGQKIREHLLLYGIVRSYSPGVHYGENDEDDDYSSDEEYEGEDSGSEDNLGDNTVPSREPFVQPLSKPSGQPSTQPSVQPSIHPLVTKPSTQPLRKLSGPPMTQPLVQSLGHLSTQSLRQPLGQSSLPSSGLEESSVNSSEEPHLTYRQKRRLEQAQRNGRKRGQTRGLKYQGKNPRERPYAKISEELRRVVGPNAGEFICRCSLWVKEYCPLNSWSWHKMDATAKQRLYEKILENFNLPVIVDGKDVTKALSLQCSLLYKFWRYRLKERYYVGYSKEEAMDNKPQEVDSEQWKWLVYEYWGSEKQELRREVNRKNQRLSKIKAANGALSTARIYDGMVQEPIDPTKDAQQEEQEPLYLKLYERTKRHKDGSWDPEALTNYEKLKEFHASQIAEHGEDNVSLKEAYIEVLNTKAGYVKGLGPGPELPRKGRIGRESNELKELNEEINVLKSSNEELKASNEVLKVSNEELKALNVEIKHEMNQMRLEAIERDKKLKEEIKQMLQCISR